MKYVSIITTVIVLAGVGLITWATVQSESTLLAMLVGGFMVFLGLLSVIFIGLGRALGSDPEELKTLTQPSAIRSTRRPDNARQDRGS